MSETVSQDLNASALAAAISSVCKHASFRRALNNADNASADNKIKRSFCPVPASRQKRLVHDLAVSSITDGWHGCLLEPSLRAHSKRAIALAKGSIEVSGIAAIFRLDRQPVAAEMLQRMTAAMDYRGPDSIDHALFGPCALGHCAMHTSAASRQCMQPLSASGEDVHISFDGFLIYSKALRQELCDQGMAAHTAADAELALLSYLAWDDDCARHLDGEFAFVVWDGRKQLVFCAGDHAGLRPLHYHWDGKALLVASDIGAILAALPEKPAPNLAYLAQHVANAWYTHEVTPWEGIQRLPPACSLTVDAAGPDIQVYWELPTNVTIRYGSDAEYVEHYRNVLCDSVVAVSNTDAPLACDVSGGLDSSAIFCLADRLLEEGRLPAPELVGMTLKAPQGTWADEARYVEAVERHTGRTIHRAELFCPPLAWFTQQGENDQRLPFLPNSVMLRAPAIAAAQQGCRVQLVGQGGDQWLDGHPHHIRQDLAAGDWPALARGLKADWDGMGAGWTARQTIRQLLSAAIPDGWRAAVLRRLERRSANQHGESDHMLTAEMRREIADLRNRYFDKTSKGSADRRLKTRKISFPFALLVYDMLNLQSARDGIEYRHPMMTRKFMEFSATTPENIRWRGGTTKFIHRQAMVGMMPPEIIERHTKAGFNQVFHLHLHEIVEFCKKHSGNPAFSTIVAKEELKADLEQFTRLPLMDLPIWRLWGYYAVAAFLSQHES